MLKFFKVTFGFVGIVFVLFWTRIVQWAGVTTLVGDTPQMVEGIKKVILVFDAWVSSPPQWATTLALLSVATAYVAFLFGDSRLIHFTKFLFKKDFRLAELQKFVGDELILAVKFAIEAERALQKIDWTPIPDPANPPNIRPHPEDPTLIQFFEERLRSDNGDPIQRLLVISDVWEGNDDQVGLISKLQQRVFSAEKNCDHSAQKWASYDAGYDFLEGQFLEKWHEYKEEIDEFNKVLDELKAQLERKRDEWLLIQDQPNTHKFLKDIDLHMLR